MPFSGVTLDNVVVTAHRAPLVRQSISASTQVIQSEQIKKVSARKQRRNARRQKKNRQAKKSHRSSTTVVGNRSEATHYYIDGVRMEAEGADTKEYKKWIENTFVATQEEAISTFGIDVDHASYTNVRRHLENGNHPPADAIRPEEMINYFDYNYPQPMGQAPFALYSEMALCPWKQEHYLLHLGLHGEEVIAEQMPPSNLVFLIDVSGSMGSANKLGLLKPAFKLLVDQLRPEDKVSIVVYAGAAGLVLPPTPGSDKASIRTAIDNLRSGGSTAGGAGIELAYKTAAAAFLPNGNNRVILATDGDFNVGVSGVGELERLIAKKRKSNIFLTVLGFGFNNLKDNRLEVLADKGNGQYAFIDNMREAQKVFGQDLVGTLYTIAKDVKLQIKFDPKLVQSYRLIGYENRMLDKEDFDDDTKDAGELGAGHTVTALYEIVPTDQYQKMNRPPIEWKLRYKLPKRFRSKLIKTKVEHPIVDSDQTSDNFRFAAAVAGFSLLLKDSPYRGNVNTEMILDLANNALGNDPYGYRDGFIELVERYEALESVTVK